MAGSADGRGGTALAAELRRRFGDAAVPAEGLSRYDSDETEGRGIKGAAEAVVLPESAEQAAEVLAWCCEHGAPVVPRGGGSGFSGGAVPDRGGVVVSTERMRAVRSFDPLLWRIEVEAGITTADVQRLARENGLYYPPDPGAAEQSNIGGNLATNAGGPHAFKYGVTGAWVTGVEAAIPPGLLVSSGGPVRKDVSGYDLASLLIGSEGTLGLITSAWLRLIPAPEARLPVAAIYPDVRSGCEAIERVVGSGILAAAIEYLDGATLAAARSGFPGGIEGEPGFMVIAEADGTRSEAEALKAELVEALSDGADRLHSPADEREVEELWRWRDSVSIAVTAQLGGKVSEDIVVPLDRLGEAVERTLEIGPAQGLPACSWGHAGDGNLHSTFMLDRRDAEAIERAERAAGDLFRLGLELGGRVSGEHGIGIAKNAGLAAQMSPAEAALHGRIKSAFDPEGVMNPGTKTPDRPSETRI